MGFKILGRPSFGFDGAWLELGDMQLHVIERNPNWNSPEDPNNTNGKPRSPAIAITRGHHVAFRTNNLDKCKQNLKKMNIQYYEAKLAKDVKNRQIWFYDPDGNGLELFQPYNPSELKSKL